jgi:hypothetical protein
MFSVYGQVGLKCVRDGKGNFPLHPLIKPTVLYFHRYPHLIQALPIYVKKSYVVNNLSQKGTKLYVRFHFSSLMNKEKCGPIPRYHFWQCEKETIKN